VTPTVLSVAPSEPPAAEPASSAPADSAADDATADTARDDKPSDARPRRSASRDARRKVETGTLWVEASPWAWVTVGNQRKEAPDRFYLAPGTYQVKFFNQDNGITKYQRVTIESGKVQRIRESLDD
jgi:hypothetical protein